MREGCDPNDCKMQCTLKLSRQERQNIYKDFRGPNSTDETQVIINYNNHNFHNS